MDFNFTKISLQQKLQGFGVLFDPTGKEQGERAVTALGGIIVRAKRCHKILLHAHFLSSFWFLSLSWVLTPFLSSHVSKCHFPTCMLDRNSPIKEREKLPNLLKKSYITLNWTYELPIPVFSERNLGIWTNPLFQGCPPGGVVQLAVKFCPSNSKFKLPNRCLFQAEKNNNRDGSRRVWLTNTAEGEEICDCRNLHWESGWWPSGNGNALHE